MTAKKPEAHVSSMQVRKRDGSLVSVDLNKIVKAVSRSCAGLEHVDALKIATKTIAGLYDGATTKALDQLSIQTAANLVAEEPEYGRVASRMLANVIDKEVRGQNIESFTQAIAKGLALGLINDRTSTFVQQHAHKLNRAIDPKRDDAFEYFGLRTVYDRYLLKHPETREVLETPQYFFMRVACALSRTAAEAVEFYGMMSRLEYLPSTPTLFNSGTSYEQLSSCFLLDSPEDDLSAIYDKYKDVALLSKFSGGIGISFSRVRSRGSLIRSTNGHSNGIVPWLKTLDSSVAGVNQGGRRQGACAVYLEPWHADVEEFLELRENTGDAARRTYNLNLANWIPDLFMRRVKEDAMWSLFDPKEAPLLVDCYGDKFEELYVILEEAGAATKQVKARDLYAKMMRCLAQTGVGWMNFKDATNFKSNQTNQDDAVGPTEVIHTSNLCTEIAEVSSADETAVCNLGSINLAQHFRPDGSLDLGMIRETARKAVLHLDRVIDLNLYSIPSAKTSNNRWRPIGLGLMGLQDVFFKLHLSFDDQDARRLSRKIQEHIYFAALDQSCSLAQQFGAHPSFPQTRAARGDLQFDLWAVTPDGELDWAGLKARIKEHGLRNSLVIAIAPTATIASIAGCYECIEPQVSNLFKRETLSGDFLQVNKYLVEELRRLNLWNDETRNALKHAEGSVQSLPGIHEDVRERFRTAWEVPMRALIDMAAERGAYIDQSQSLNLFMAAPSIGALSSMYMYAWEKGIKTTYYLRSRPATKIAKTTVEVKTVSDADGVACSLENPEACEACQ